MYKSQVKEINGNGINNNNDNNKDNDEQNKNHTEKEILNINNKIGLDLYPQKQSDSSNEKKSNDCIKNEEISEMSEDNKRSEIKDVTKKEIDSTKENDKSLNNNMSIDMANEVIYKLINYNLNFKSFEELKDMNDYVHLTISNKLYQLPESEESDFKVSYYKINHEELEGTSASSSSFDIETRAKEFGIKLKGLIDMGEVTIFSSDIEILITVNILKFCNSTHETKGSIIINIVFPKQRYPPRYDQIKLDETFEIADKITKGFKIGHKFATAVILECIIKKGITSILAGPISASIGFSD